ncbi:MAG: hypothetical protein L0Y54_22235, partial [Sporichthyaceae bacterium]|nr:hypothetical protein [Sporichthyaceae bacterium]
MRGEPDGPVYVVQFPHPGPEHRPGPAATMQWNTGAHARKFLHSPGRYLDGDGTAGSDQLVFWGEWEPPSRVIERWPADGGLPRYLHQPVWSRPGSRQPRQNTDPWVFGETFLFSNCRQLTPAGNPSALQRLTRGSIILFGSQLDGRFVLDTVFVVADAAPYTPNQAEHLDLDDAARACIIEPLTLPGRKDHSGAGFMLYRGATVDAPVAG